MVAWAGGTITQGFYLAERSAGVWLTDLTSTPSGAWAPGVATGGGQTVAVWMEGTNHLDSSTEWSLISQKVGASRQEIAGDVFGEGLPDLSATAEGFHLVYAAATTKVNNQILTDLYYTHRTLAASSWAAPTKVVSYDTVIDPSALSGGVENAQVALDGDAIHIVWEQKQLLPLTSPPYSQVDHSIWYIAGSISGGSWSQPVRLSPATQRIAVRPTIAAGDGGRIHVTYTELIGPRDRPEQQHIYYRSIAEATLTRLNPADQPIRVNGLFPTKATSAIAVQGDRVCVAWHGYYDDGPDTLEDVTLRCSHNAGETWGVPLDVSDGNSERSSIFPAVGFDSEGLVHVAWAEYELDVTGFRPFGIYHRSGEVRESYFVYMPAVMR
jgi:hypothetical protein